MFPISKKVFSPSYFKSWGISPNIAPWNILQLFPILVFSFITEDEEIWVSFPIVTLSSIITNGPIFTLSPIIAFSLTIAVKCILLLI